MRLAISNLAWDTAQDSDVARSMRDAGAQGVELAPTKVWADPARISAGEIALYRRAWERRGLPIVALQSLTYGRDDVALFGSPQERANLGIRLTEMIQLAVQLGADRLVFGAPKHRVRGLIDPAPAMDVAVSFFSEVAATAVDHGVCVCIEPNPPQYGCDFIMTAAQGMELVELVASPGFGLHLDTAAMKLGGDKVEEVLPKAEPILRHFHISEPGLGPVGRRGSSVDHEAAGAGLRAIGYGGWVSIEMLPAPGEQAPVAVERALKFALLRYFGTGEPGD